MTHRCQLIVVGVLGFLFMQFQHEPVRAPAAEVQQDPIDFSVQIAPLIQQHCIRCHEPGNRQGDISLRTGSDIKENGYIVAGKPEESMLLDLVESHNGEKPEMPKQGRPLSSKETAVLKKWIVQGANWPNEFEILNLKNDPGAWWAFKPLAPLTANLSTDLSDHEINADSSEVQLEASRIIDSLIRKKLKANSLKPNRRADRRTLIRRLHFDLHGLPPNPEEVKAFVEDTDPQAYSKLIDRLLDSPHYGERYARHWLDLAHYADTHGFERDKRRDNAWRYRDYVIASFNEDKPYDLFLKEQLAGDVLWPDNPESVVATGFLAAGPWDLVGQVETKSPALRRAARSLDLDDMATQVMTAAVAMTVNCARCHDHKLDPISQREYYQLRAVFASVKRADRVISESGSDEYQRELKSLNEERNALDYEIGKLQGDGLNLADIVGGGNGFGTGTYRHGIDTRSAKVQTRDFGQLGNVITNRFSESAYEFVDGVFIPDGKNGEAEIPVSSTGIAIKGIPTTSGKAWDMIRNGPVASQHSTILNGIDFSSDEHSLLGLHANAGITFDLLKIRSVTNWAEMSFQASVGYFGADDGSRADVWIFLDGKKVFAKLQIKRSHGVQQVDLKIPAAARFLTLVSTDGGNGYGMDQIGFGDPLLRPAATTALTKLDLGKLEQLRKKRASVTQRLKSLGGPPRFYGPVLEDTPPVVQVLERGNAETPVGPPLPPAALSALEMLKPELGTVDTPEAERRIALAEWITSSRNPLTARVIANRMWQWHFGNGLVNTSSDFGAGGDIPSHPELLDLLAGSLIQNGWSLKRLHKMILLSETYQQDSRHAADHPALERDAANRLLWRQNPRRIEAESIRDSVLSVSGKLNLKRGGPGFEDFQYQDAYAPIYTYITADKPSLWRRSIYRYIVRTTPNRFLTTLDCPDPANLTAKRERTTTPLQSLALYNNEFMLLQSQYFADRLVDEFPLKTTDQIRRAFELALSRPPNDRELQIATDLVQRSGLFTLCRSLLNSNEFVHVD